MPSASRADFAVEILPFASSVTNPMAAGFCRILANPELRRSSADAATTPGLTTLRPPERNSHRPASVAAALLCGESGQYVTDVGAG